MRAVKLQFFLSFAVMGSIMPFLSVYFKEDRGLTETQIGYVIGSASFAVLITPALATLLADTRLDPRRLAGLTFVLSGSFLFLMAFFEGFWPTLLLFSLHSLAFVTMIPLQDGMNFSIQRKREDAGAHQVPYHRIRVWGTVGFIIPSLIIYMLLQTGTTTAVILFTAFFFALLGLLNTWFIPDPRKAMPVSEDSSANPIRNLPSLSAVRALLRVNVLVFCIGMALAHIASTAYFAFYPLYLTEVVGLDRKWIGLVFNLGVAIEIVFVLALGKMIEAFGLRKLIVTGIVCMAVRMALLALFPTAGIAIAGQILHGLIVIGLVIVPVMYLNRQAEDRYRNSIQGIYIMTVVGGSRIGGSVLAGHLAQSSLILLFLISATLCLVTVGLFIFAFRVEAHDRLPL